LSLVLCLGGVLACRSELPPSSEPGATRAVAQQGPAASAVGWDAVSGILERIVPPTFPALECNIASYGAVPGGQTDASPAIRRAI
jgi:hypothetical protein